MRFSILRRLSFGVVKEGGNKIVPYSMICLRTTNTLDGKEADEAHPELKQTNFISKLKPLTFAKKPQVCERHAPALIGAH